MSLQCQDDGVELLANAAVNPAASTVYYLHDLWRKVNFGSTVEPLLKLAEKVELYKGLGRL
jgi:hypothetical protein